MAALDIQTARRIPRTPVKINWQHPLARGLVFYSMPGLGPNGGRDLVTNALATPFGATANPASPSQYGMAVASGSVSTDGFYYGPAGVSSPMASINIGFTVYALCNITTTGNLNIIWWVPWADGAPANPYGTGLFQSGTSTRASLAYAYSGSAQGSGTSGLNYFLNTDGWTGYGASRTNAGGNANFYKNGIVHTAGSVMPNSSPVVWNGASQGRPTIMNGSRTGSEWGYIGQCAVVATWNRQLDDREHSAFHANPFQVLAPAGIEPTRTVWLMVAPPGGTVVHGSCSLVANSVAQESSALLLAAPSLVANSGITAVATVIAYSDALPANAAIADAATVVASGDVLQANSVLLAVTSSVATFVANSGITVSAQILAPASAVGTSAATDAVVVLTTAGEASNSAIAEAAILLASAALQSNSAVTATASSTAKLVGASAMTVVALVLAPASLAANSACTEAATLLAPTAETGNAAVSDVALLLATATLQGTSAITAIGSAASASVVSTSVCTVVATILTAAPLPANSGMSAAVRLLAANVVAANSSINVTLIYGPLTSTYTTKALLAATFSTSSKLAAAFALVSKLSAVFIRSVSVPNPNSTITSTLTATDSTGALQSNLSAVSVTVTFPDGSTQTLTLAGGTVTNAGSGKYSVTYTTKGIGECLEEWTFTAGDGVTKGDFRNVTPVSY